MEDFLEPFSSETCDEQAYKYGVALLQILLLRRLPLVVAQCCDEAGSHKVMPDLPDIRPCSIGWGREVRWAT